jgi:hypothetical protein
MSVIKNLSDTHRVIKKLADLHEEDVHRSLGGHRAKSSGNQWNDQGDGHTSRYGSRFGWCWDCKCAMPQTKSISITRDMVEKISAQAHGERPILPLRFYSTERGKVEHDLVVLRMDDFVELLEVATGEDCHE